MQTGFNTLVDEDDSVEEFVSNAKSMFLVLLEEGMRAAGNYAKATGRDVVTQEDILYGLQYQAHQFQNIENIQSRSQDAIASWEGNKTMTYVDEMNQEWSVTIDGWCDEGLTGTLSRSSGHEYQFSYFEEGEIEGIPEEMTEHFGDFLDEITGEQDEMTVENHDPFKRAPDSHSEQIALMNFYHDHWDEWKPETDVEKLLKESIDARLKDIIP